MYGISLYCTSLQYSVHPFPYFEEHFSSSRNVLKNMFGKFPKALSQAAPYKWKLPKYAISQSTTSTCLS